MVTAATDQDIPLDSSEFRTPPHDLLAEQGVLGGVMLSKVALEDVIDCGLRGHDFYRPAHEAIWESILALWASDIPADAATVHNELNKRGDLARAGGAAYLHTLISEVSVAANARYYAEIVRERAVLRRLVAAGTKTIQMGYATDGGDVDAIVDAALAEIMSVADDRQDLVDDDDLIGAIQQSLDELEHGTKARTPTGIPDLDRQLNGGLLPGTVTTVAARPGIGKTTVARQLLLNVGIDQGLPCGYSSLEQSRQDLLVGAYACLGRIDYGRLQRAPQEPLGDAEWRSLSKAAARLRDSKIRITDTADMRVGAVRSNIRRMIRKQGACSLWVVDYLQLLTPDVPLMNREQEVARMMRSLKLTALGLGVPIVLLAQLNRDLEKSKRPPILADLRESGSVEQDSDTVILLDRDLKTTPDVIFFDIAKQRRGVVSTAEDRIKMEFRGEYQLVQHKPWRASDALAKS